MEGIDRLGNKVMIKCEHVHKVFENKRTKFEVIHDLNLEIKENEFVVLFGPGQCGKTTILNVLSGIDVASSGTVMVNNKKVSGPSPERGIVYQMIALFPWLTVMGNVEFGLEMAGMKKKERLKRAQYYIDLVGLTGFEKYYPIKLSGGMQQRVGIARSYCNNPKVIFMDEPFGSLDAQTRYMMEKEVMRICSKEKKTVVFITNNIEEAIYLADRIILLNDCPTGVRKEYIVDIPKPREYTSVEFLKLRNQITQNMSERS